MTMRLIRESGVFRINKSFPFLLLALLLTSCISPRHLVRLYDYDIETVPGQEALVFGRVKVVENEESLDWNSSSFAFTSFLIHIEPEAGPEPVSYTYYVKEDGSFYWPLSAGGYTITDFSWTVFTGIIGSDRRVIFARFVVPEETPLIYIGTLTIHSEAGRYTMRVEDHYDHALQRLIQRFPNVKEPVTKRLMQFELP